MSDLPRRPAAALSTRGGWLDDPVRDSFAMYLDRLEFFYAEAVAQCLPNPFRGGPSPSLFSVRTHLSAYAALLPALSSRFPGGKEAADA